MRSIWPHGSLASYLALPIVAAILVAAMISCLWDVAFLDNDAAQYLSVARNILDGNGVASSIIFYEQQLVFGKVPVPQTVFPPGTSVVLAAFLAVGFKPLTAIMAAGILAFCATGVVLAVLLRKLGVGPLLAFLAAAIWFGQGTAWAVVMLGLSEILFTLATLLSTAVLLAANDRWNRFVLAGALAAAAVLIRYQGLFFVAALGIYCAWTWLRSPARRRYQCAMQAVALLVLPLIAAGLQLTRNLLLAGSPGGGPVDTAYWNAASGIDIAKSAYWALAPFLGLSVDGLSQFRWQEVTVVMGLLVLAGWLSRNAREIQSQPAQGGERHARIALWHLALCYVVVTCLALAFLATRSTGYMQGRFLLPLVPFVAAAWAMLLDCMMKAPRVRIRAALFVALLSLHAGLFGGQLRVLREWLDTLRADQRIAAMRAALAEDMAGSTLAQYLKEHVSNDAPLLATGGQLLWVLVELPVVETTPAGFSDRLWDETELQRLHHCLGVRFLLYIPGVFDPARPENRNQPLYHRMARGGEPVGLTPLLRTPKARLYKFDSMATHDAQIAQDRGNDECK